MSTWPEIRRRKPGSWSAERRETSHVPDEALPAATGPSPGEPLELTDPLWGLPHTQFTLDLDEGTPVAVQLTEQNAIRVLDATQQIRELREREKTVSPPTYKVGTENRWRSRELGWGNRELGWRSQEWSQE